jgi:hypothetical protein
MPTNISQIPNGAFNLRIPEIDENADIQTAFRLYHYGEGNSGQQPLNPQSLAGYLDSLEKGKVSRAPILIPTNANLNNFTESGFYAQRSNAAAQTGNNYPIVPPVIGVAYAGLLRVFNDGANIYQEYQVAGIPTNPVYWRAFFGNLGWTPWQGFAVEGHIHDDRYYTKQQSDNRYFPAIKSKTIRQPAISANNYTLRKDDEDVVLIMNNLSVPHNLIIPQDVTDPELNISVGTTIRVIQGNTGQTSVIPGTSNVNISSVAGNKLRSIWAVASLIKASPNNWILTGDLEDPRTLAQRRNSFGIYVQPNQPTGNIQNGDLWFW